MERDELDRRIAAAVQAVEAEIPEEVRDGLRRRLADAALRPPCWGWPQLWATVAAASLALFVLVAPQLRRPTRPEPAISQIRTEFTIPGKNIKIIWVQRDDFRLAGVSE